MPLCNVPRPGSVGPIPTDIRAFLLQADRRIREDARSLILLEWTRELLLERAETEQDS